MLRKTLVVFMIFLVGALIINGCSSSESIPYISLTTDENYQSDENEYENAIRVGIASVISPEATRIEYDNFIKYLEKKFEAPIILIQGKTYEETNQMLKDGKVDIALICSLSYVLGETEGYLEGLVVPKVDGEILYRSYIIVHNDSNINTFEELRGKNFAFTDPDSYSGRLAVLDLLNDKGEKAETFFDRTYYTYSHDYSVKSVASKLVYGAAVDSLVFDQMLELQLEDVQNLKIIEYGDWVGTPPIVVSNYVSDELKYKIRDILLNIHKDKEGIEILKQLNVEEFVPIKTDNYQPIKDMIEAVGEERWIN